MSNQVRKTSLLNIYHVIYRGVNKQLIFEDDEDYRAIIRTLRKYKDKCDYKIYAYCIMSNHIHLLISPGKMPLSRIFQHLIPSFVTWYNIKYERIGHLFQARFKSEPINDESHFLTVIRYIHQNPIKAAICCKPEDYRYSSFRNYFDNELIDSNLVSDLVSKEYFLSFNQADNKDHGMDIDEDRPRMWTDERATKIMQEASGCSNVAEFQALPPEQRDEALRIIHRMGVSANQANRITGISKGVIKKALM